MPCHQGRSSLLALLVTTVLLVSGFIQMSDGTLSVQRQNIFQKRSSRMQVINADLMDLADADIPSHVRRRRDTDSEGTKIKTDEDTKIITAATHLKDSHTQLIVYWAGKDVIICLAKDINPNSSSTLYISRNYGLNYTNETSLLSTNDSMPVLDKFLNHPKNNGHFLFTDVKNQFIYTTDDYGASFTTTKLNFKPEEIQYDPSSDRNIVAFEKTTAERQMWVSKDFGRNWTLVQEFVKSVSWDESVFPAHLYIEREEPNRRVVLMSSSSIFLDPKDTIVVLSDIEDFEIRDDYKFATQRAGNDTLKLLVSFKHGPFLAALFPNKLETKHFHVADVSNGQIFVCVSHNESVSNLYIGNEPLDSRESPKFSLSLERIMFFKPNITWTDSWLNDVADDPFVDLHRVEGLRGVYIASQLSATTVKSNKFTLDQVISLVTYDQGGEWSVIKAPEFDNDGQPIYCHLASKACSLHISQRLNEVYPVTRAVPVLSKKSAVGFVMATGTVNSSMKGHLSVFMSTDGAVSWRQLLQGNYLYNFGDHGGIIVAVKHYKIGDATNTLLYSIDEGLTWKEFIFYPEKIRVLGLMTEPGENTTVFTVFGSLTIKKPSWVLVRVDFKDAFERQCRPGEEDYKDWSPWNATPGGRCLLGRTDVYERRRPNVKCYNGLSYERLVRSQNCRCRRVDFECDFGYKERISNGTKAVHCVKDTSETSQGVKPEWCMPGVSFYNKTKGYRKIPGDTCEGGEDSIYFPEIVPCAVKNETEFMLVAKRDSVIRVNLNDFTHVETLPLAQVRAVIALDFDMKNKCLFWSDVNLDHVMRLHLDGKSEPEVLVSEDIQSVEGLAFDWLANNLYFCDGAESKIEVIRTDVKGMGRMRKKILHAPTLSKPRGIAVHPAKGYLFWTDWSADAPCIGRSWLDGSHAEKIVQDPDPKPFQPTIKWPNGLTVDVDHNKIYWVDAYLDHLATADLDGVNHKVYLAKDPRISHPFAVGIYKNYVYWDDWTTKSIYLTLKDSTDPVHNILTIQSNLPRLMDLKVYGPASQQGSNACSKNNSACSHLCLAKPDSTFTCACPDGLKLSGDDCVCPDGKIPVSGGQCDSNCKTNSTDFFKCKSGFCIPASWRCDGDGDCGDGDESDELKCGELSRCSNPNEFQCASDGRCIPDTWRCDFDNDCEDKSDEIGCESSFPKCDNPSHFQCGNGRCILSRWVCDQDDDCYDGSDEKNCTKKSGSCEPNEFKCHDTGRCISADWVCDGEPDCAGDHSDEANCTAVACPDWKFHCHSGECLLASWVCDGDADCRDSSDEANCTSRPPFIPPPPIDIFQKGNCSLMSQMFQCKTSNACIPVFWRCDGVPDCGEDDQSDEAGCDDDGKKPTPSPGPTAPPRSPTCAEDHWLCDSGDCIWEIFVCDGMPDCPGGEDEKICHNSISGCPKDHVKCGLSNACVLTSKLCDGTNDCPNNADEIGCFHNDTNPQCNSGQYYCDGGLCRPLFERCNGKQECLDAKDELNCTGFLTVYQVDGISIETVESDSADVEWWVSPELKGAMDFLPSYCDVVTRTCYNSTKWTTDRKIKLGSDTDKLQPFTNYSVTVFVRSNGMIFPPAVYKTFVTNEGVPSAPYNLTVSQTNVDSLCVSWMKPRKPNGKITFYKLFFTPPSPAADMASLAESLCISNKQSNPVFLAGTNYTFWVLAGNSAGKGNISEPITYTFNGDIAKVSDFKIKDATTTSVSLHWTTSNKAFDEFKITYEIESKLYPFQFEAKTKTPDLTITPLPPGSKFKFSIVAVYKNMTGLKYSGTFFTKGNPLPTVNSLSVSLQKKSIVLASWTPPKDSRASDWSYLVYYGKSIQEITDKMMRVETNKTSVMLTGLEACETYFVDAGVKSSFGGGPLTERPATVTTEMDEKAPPKNLQASPNGNPSSIDLSWDAPCYTLDRILGYNITIRETRLNNTYGLSNVASSSRPKVKKSIEIQYGGEYEVTVSTNVLGARKSKPAYFSGPEIPHPDHLQECSSCNPPTIFWIPPDLPQKVKEKGDVTYVVHLSEDKNFKKSKRYTSDNNNSYAFNDILDEEIYWVAVSVVDKEGLESKLSTPISFQHYAEASSQISISTGNVLGIVITVILVLGVLTGTLAVFIVRHRRLRMSFLNFASSHYSTSSGAATFQQSMEEEHDSPVIRGFSDDEPLLVA